MKEIFGTLAKEYEGELLPLSNDKEIVSVKYGSGSLNIFNKLEILVARQKNLKILKSLFLGTMFLCQ